MARSISQLLARYRVSPMLSKKASFALGAHCMKLRRLRIGKKMCRRALKRRYPDFRHTIQTQVRKMGQMTLSSSVY